MHWNQYTVERQEKTVDDFDDSEASWKKIGTILAAKMPLRGAELVAARQVNEQVDSKLRFRWSSKLADLSSRDRLKRGEKTLHIQSVINKDDSNIWFECQVVEHDG